MSIHESGENYLETIYVLGQQNGSVRSIDVATHLKVTKPTVSVAVHTLERNGFLIISPEGHLQLTEKGLDVALSIYERHQLLTAILTDLGVPTDIASEDACKIEHDLSDTSFEHLKAAYFRKEIPKS